MKDILKTEIDRLIKLNEKHEKLMSSERSAEQIRANDETLINLITAYNLQPLSAPYKL